MTYTQETHARKTRITFFHASFSQEPRECFTHHNKCNNSHFVRVSVRDRVMVRIWATSWCGAQPQETPAAECNSKCNGYGFPITFRILPQSSCKHSDKQDLAGAVAVRHRTVNGRMIRLDRLEDWLQCRPSTHRRCLTRVYP